MIEGQVRRYFVGLVGFAFIVCWAAVGITVAIAALTACIVVVLAPDMRRKAPPRSRRPRPVRARPLDAEEPEELPLVPDEPSLIVEAIPRW